MRIASFVRGTVVAAAALAFAACGGGGSDNNPPPNAGGGGVVVGAAGGTVSGPNGAKIEIPPGALASDVRIDIEPTSAGAPPLPSGLPPSGAMFAFTPHGTTFAVPVTVTLPFDSASVPTDAAPQFYKTNAQNQWEQVANATFSANSVVAQISGFSFGQVVVPPLTRFTPRWEWEFQTFPMGAGGPTTLPEPDGQGRQNGGLLEKVVDFGKAFFDRPYHTISLGSQLEDGEANGLVAASEDGIQFGAFTEAPHAQVFGRDNAGSSARLVQRQSFKKHASDATLTYTVSIADIETTDFHNVDGNHGDLPEPDRSRQLISGELQYSVIAYTSTDTVFSASAHAQMSGNGSIWTPLAASGASSRHKPLWNQQDFDFSVKPITFSLGSAACLGNGASMKLKTPRSIAVDISKLDIEQEFTVEVTTQVTALNHRFGTNGIQGCDISSASAFLRDPQQIGGSTVAFAGLEPTNNPLPTPADQPLQPPVSCAVPTSDAGVLQFAGPLFNLSEDAGVPPVIMVTRTGGSRGEVSATFTTSDGTAIAGTDYVPVNQTVFFADGDAEPRFVTVSTLPNQVVTPDKTVRLTLSQPGGCATLGTQSTAILKIIDDVGVPAPVFTIGGAVNGMTGSGLVLEETFRDVSITANGSFVFPGVVDGTPYDVHVKTQPTNPVQICTVTRGKGTIAGANVSDVAVDCATPVGNGALDSTFGSSGKVFSNLLAISDTPYSVAVQGDGRILLVGTVSGSNARRDIAVARLNSDGTTDTGFGNAGVATADLAGNDDQGRAIAVQPDGKIVVAGITNATFNTSSEDFVVVRFNANGSLDTTFGTGGFVTTDFAGNTDEAQAIVIQPDGRIVVAGTAALGSTPTTQETDFALARYNSNGTPDGGFGTGGKTTTHVAGGLSRAQAIALQSDGHIVVSGPASIGNGGLDQTGVARYNANGSVDTTFGPITVPIISGTGLAVQGDGKVLLAGFVGTTQASASDFAVVRVNADGKLDSTFGGGIVRTDFGGTDDTARALALQADGRIVVAGSMRNTAVSTNVGFDFALARYNTDGSLDTSFASGGKLAVDFFGASDLALAVTLQPDGKLVAAGTTRNGTAGGIGLVRVLP
jgi:uncharacterized delta-60 repeat protein